MLRSNRCVVVAAAGAFALLTACGLTMSNEARLERAAQALERGDASVAAGDLSEVLRAEPDNWRARLLRAQLVQRAGDAETALSDLDRAAAAGAPAAQVAPVRVQTLLDLGRYEDVLAATARPGVLAESQRGTFRGAALSALGRFVEADEAFAIAEAASPDDMSVLVARARSLLTRGAAAEAGSLLARITALPAADANAWLLRAISESGAGREDAARESLQKAIAISAKSNLADRVAMHALLVESQLKARDFTAASATVSALERISPRAPVVAYLKGRVALARGNATQALGFLQQAAKAAPEHIQTRLMLAAALLAQNSLEQAEAELKQVLARRSDSREARKLLARVYLLRDRPDEARRLLEEARTPDQPDPEIEWLLGTLLVRSGNNASGVDYLERSVAAAPTDVARRLDLARVYLAAGARAKAITTLEELPPDVDPYQRQSALLLARISGRAPADARLEIVKWLAEQPEGAPAVAAAGAGQLLLGDVGAAVTTLRRAAALAPRETRVIMLLSGAEARAGRAEEAEALLKRALVIDPRSAPAMLGLAQIALARSDFATAATWLERLIGTEPANVHARFLLAGIAIQQNDVARATGLLQQAVTAADNDPQVAIRAGDALLRVGRAKEAAIVLKAARDASGSNDVGAALARALATAGNAAEAMVVLDTVLKADPKHSPSLALATEIDARAGRLTPALNRLDAAAAKGAASDVLNVLRGDAYFASRQFDSAAARYASAMKSAPSASVAVKLYRVRRAAGERDAESTLVDWLQAHPGDSAPRFALAEHWRAAGKMDEAVREYERVLQANPRDALVLNNLAWVLHEQGNPRAVELASRAYEIAGRAPAVADTYGWILLEGGKLAEGRQILEKAAAANPRDADIQYHLAVAFAKTGDNVAARRVLEPLLASTVAFQSREQARSLLQTIIGNGDRTR